jgi:hypothetical protein
VGLNSVLKFHKLLRAMAKQSHKSNDVISRVSKLLRENVFD